jgi:hypothetical protein
MKISSLHNITIITTTTIIMVGAGMGPSSWCLAIGTTTITTTIITIITTDQRDHSGRA